MFEKPVIVLIMLTASLALSKCEKQPNFVLIVTDDQDEVLDGMTPMHYVMKYIAKEGAVFANSYTTSPICCPSRSSILSGLYLHNHGTINNSIAGGCYGNSWRQLEHRTFPKILHDGGYETFYAGKYMNRYGNEEMGGPKVVPPGWSYWHGLVGNSRYYNYTLSSNGVPVYNQDVYLTDVIRDMGIDFLQTRSPAKPFLMFLAPPAPHAPFTPPPRYVNHYNNFTVKKTPTFNAVPKQKHWLMNLPPVPLPDEFLPVLDEVYRNRWETLLAVDEMVYDLYVELEQQDLLNETYIIYTSDNGYHIGQFSQAIDKRQPYETDIKVPLAIRGPGIERKTVIYDPVINVDLAPTVLHLAGFDIPKEFDGKVINFERRSPEDMVERFLLVENTGERDEESVDGECPWSYDSNLAFCVVREACKCEDSWNNTYACAIGFGFNKHIKYCKFYDAANFEEMYDLMVDPHETKNIAHEVFPAIKNWYKVILEQLQKCTGAGCLDPLPENAEIF